jgi:SAM-dependent methyltransferase
MNGNATVLKQAAVGDQYILSGRSDHDRLRMLSEMHDSETRTLLRRAGFSPACRFVEFGCGMGYVTCWAASEGAHATGIDVNEEHVQKSQQLARQQGLDNANFRCANIYEPRLEEESVDIAYCRWLMVHLRRPVEAMRIIYRALKPGGVMVCEETGVSAIYSEPPSAAYEKALEICLRAGRDRGVDYNGGRRAHLWAREAGFELVHVAAYHPHYLNGPHKGFWNWTFSNAVLGLVEEGVLSEDRWKELVAGMTAADNSPDTVVAHCRMHQLIAKKPRT